MIVGVLVSSAVYGSALAGLSKSVPKSQKLSLVQIRHKVLLLRRQVVSKDAGVVAIFAHAQMLRAAHIAHTLTVL